MKRERAWELEEREEEKEPLDKKNVHGENKRHKEKKENKTCMNVRRKKWEKFAKGEFKGRDKKEYEEWKNWNI